MPRPKRTAPAPDLPTATLDLADPPPPAAPDPDWHYETAVTTIEDRVRQLESGELSIEAAFDCFAQAAAELKRCEEFLGDRQAQMTVAIELLGRPGEALS